MEFHRNFSYCPASERVMFASVLHGSDSDKLYSIPTDSHQQSKKKPRWGSPENPAISRQPSAISF
jgi:hypothetical protein